MRRLLVFGLCLSVLGCSGAQGTRTSTASSTPGKTPISHAEVVQGTFQLVFDLPKGSWTTGEAIDGVATLTVIGPSGVNVGGSGGGLIGFGFAEVGGARRVDPVWSADCGPYRLDPSLTTHIKKSGAFDPAKSDADFYASFFADPQVHLPPGDWTISAVADFVEETGCTGQSHQMTATALVHVAP
jgi:hypothetical protein